MQIRIAAALLVTVVLYSGASAEEKISIREVTETLRLRMHSPTPITRPAVRPTRSAKPWIPVGKFGLELKNGSRIVGVPSKTWSAMLKTRFGKVTIPRDRISKIETTAGEVRVYLKNGDRVSGALLSGTMEFVTRFGRLSVPLNELIRLSTRGSVVRTVPTSVNKLWCSEDMRHVLDLWERAWPLKMPKRDHGGVI